ncbi:L-lactate dehydrogenase [Microgenomates group bacterium]|nr:L-lactate dehydrogenase [Microgenomates group bacterium]
MSKKKFDNNKVAIIGTGKVGMTGAYALLLQGVANEILLIGRDKQKILGEKLDLEHGMTFLSPTTIMVSDDYAQLAGSDVVVVTAGAPQEDAETRLDLAAKNIAIIEDITKQIVKYAPDAIVIVVSNPVDVLTYKAYLKAGFPKGQIFGSGTVLDTSRFRFHLGQYLRVNPRSVHTYVLGEHGDSSLPFLSGANVGGQKLTEFPNLTEEKIQAAYEAARDAAYHIIRAKGATYYAIGVMIAQLVDSVLRDAKSVLPVSIPLHNYHGHSGISLSVPCLIGRSGVEKIFNLEFSRREESMFAESVETVKKYL